MDTADSIRALVLYRPAAEFPASGKPDAPTPTVGSCSPPTMPIAPADARRATRSEGEPCTVDASGDGESGDRGGPSVTSTWENLLDAAFLPTTSEGDATRIMVAGVTGMGKSRSLRAIVEFATSRGLVDLALVLDDKKRAPQFSGHLRADMADFAARPPNRPPPVIVFRGDPQAGIRCTPDSLAAAALRAVRRDKPIRVGIVLDELARVAIDGYWIERSIRVEGEAKPRKITTPYRDVTEEGRALGAHLWYTTLDPLNVPRQLKVQTSGVLVMGLRGPALPYTTKLFGFPSDLAAAAATFQRGQFAFYAPGSGVWDGVIAQFPPPTPPEVQP